MVNNTVRMESLFEPRLPANALRVWHTSQSIAEGAALDELVEQLDMLGVVSPNPRNFQNCRWLASEDEFEVSSAVEWFKKSAVAKMTNVD